MARLISAWLPMLSGVAVALGLVLGSPALRRSLLLLLVSLAVAWCMARLIRWGFPLPRPFQVDAGMRWIEHSGRASFPSMHACCAFAFAQALTLGYAKRFHVLIALAWISALAIGWSRVHLGVHFPSDIMAGAVLGCASAWVVFALANAWVRRRTPVPPTPTR